MVVAGHEGQGPVALRGATGSSANTGVREKWRVACGFHRSRRTKPKKFPVMGSNANDQTKSRPTAQRAGRALRHADLFRSMRALRRLDQELVALRSGLPARGQS
jgi:hypothetical protein